MAAATVLPMRTEIISDDLLPAGVPAFRPAAYRIKLADAAWEHRACAALRRQVFCDEQQLFVGDDRDSADDVALPIAAVACVAGIPEQVVGTVRIHQPEHGLWFGSRLAVHADFRGAAWIGSELIRHAVGSAQARGCRRFLAHVQIANVGLFRRLHWHPLETLEVCGQPHVLMWADLEHYPARPEADIGFVCVARRAA